MEAGQLPGRATRVCVQWRWMGVRPTSATRRLTYAAFLVVGMVILALGHESGAAISASRATAVTLSVSPQGDDRTCARGSQVSCATFDRAYAIARLGDTVAIAAGSYAAQRITRKQGKTGSTDQADVVFEPRRGASVTVQGLEVDGASHLTLRGIRDGRNPQGSFNLMNAGDVTWDGLDAANFYVDGSNNVTIRGGDWGPCTVPGPCSNSKLDVETGSNVLVENARFHDYRIVAGSGEHFECLIIFGGRNITLSNNRFENCEFYNIFLQHPTWADGRFDGRSPSQIIMRGNIFSPTIDNGEVGRTSAIAFSSRGIAFTDIEISGNWFTGAASISVDDDGTRTPVRDFLIARNSFVAGRVLVDNVGLEGLSVSKNIAMKGGPCLAGVAYSENLFTSELCGASDKHRVFGYSVADGKLQVVPGEADTVRAVFSAAEKQMTPSSIAKTLRRKRPMPVGGWRCRTVDALLRERAYLGGVFGGKGAHPRVVTYRSWRLSRRALARSSAC
jgi:Right handed beta helix region